MARLEIKLKSNVKELAAKIKALDGNLEQPIRDSLTELQVSVDERFEGQGFPPRRWQEHSEKTKKRRPDGRILRDKGALLASVTSDTPNDDTVFGVTGSLGEFGSRMVYAAVHQFGSKRKRADGSPVIPARPYLAVTEQDEQDIAEIFRGFLKAKIEE